LLGGIGTGFPVLRRTAAISLANAVTEEETQELKRRELASRGSHSEPEVRGKTVILIDDGIATGSTMRAAARTLAAQHPARLIVAVPTVARASKLRPEVYELVALMTPDQFYGVGEWYKDFRQIGDAQVTDLLKRARSWTVSPNVEVGKGGEE
jgi:putative phosphoribosyl transferase